MTILKLWPQIVVVALCLAEVSEHVSLNGEYKKSKKYCAVSNIFAFFIYMVILYKGGFFN